MLRSAIRPAATSTSYQLGNIDRAGSLTGNKAGEASYAGATSSKSMHSGCARNLLAGGFHRRLVLNIIIEPFCKPGGSGCLFMLGADRRHCCLLPHPVGQPAQTSRQK
ncbi:MAG: hypothetical protein H6569_10510 [Lewinellaceae bacterium]|nr:hypothetical protein [Lewinellaceae bacterium]